MPWQAGFKSLEAFLGLARRCIGGTGGQWGRVCALVGGTPQDEGWLRVGRSLAALIVGRSCVEEATDPHDITYMAHRQHTPRVHSDTWLRAIVERQRLGSAAAEAA